MADMRIFGQVAQSQSPYGRVTPLGQPGALRPSPYKSALGEMLGNMFDELNTADNSEFKAQEKVLLDAIASAEGDLKKAIDIHGGKEQRYGEKGYGTSQGNRFEIEHANTKYQGLKRNLEELRANPPEQSSSFERGVDSVVSSAGDLFGIDTAASQEKEERANKASNLLNYWR